MKLRPGGGREKGPWEDVNGSMALHALGKQVRSLTSQQVTVSWKKQARQERGEERRGEDRRERRRGKVRQAGGR